jgi:hypothetical protein
VEDVYAGFKAASRRAEQLIPVEGTIWVTSDPEAEINPENRCGSMGHVENYMKLKELNLS